MESHDLYNYKRRLELVLKTIEKANTSNNNKQLLLKYKDDNIANGLSIARCVRVSYDLLRLARLLKKDFDKVNEENMKKVMVRLEDEDISERTKYDFKVAVKKFYKWLRKSKNYPEEVEWIKPKFKDRNHKLPEELPKAVVASLIAISLTAFFGFNFYSVATGNFSLYPSNLIVSVLLVIPVALLFYKFLK